MAKLIRITNMHGIIEQLKTMDKKSKGASQVKSIFV